MGLMTVCVQSSEIGLFYIVRYSAYNLQYLNKHEFVYDTHITHVYHNLSTRTQNPTLHTIHKSHLPCNSQAQN
jgi:hypothetical protein